MTIEFDRKLYNGSEFTSIEFGRFYELTWYKEGGNNVIQLLMGWLKGMIGHFMRGCDACCPQLISLIDCEERLLKLQYIHVCNRFPHTTLKGGNHEEVWFKHTDLL